MANNAMQVEFTDVADQLKELEERKRLIDAAVLVERERCAEIASRIHPPDGFNLQRMGAWIDAQVEIEKKIRGGETNGV